MALPGDCITGCHKPADRALNICTFNLLTEERWELAERILVYALGIPEKLRDDGEVHFFHRINLCIARKFSGKEYSSLLADMNWDPLHPKYHFARAILDDRFSDAACLMSSEAVRNSIDKNELTEWPLLREFRKSAQFQQTFREMFGHEFQADLLSRAKEEMKEQQDAGEEEKQP